MKAWWSLLHCVINVSPAQKMCTDHLLLITQVCTNCSIQSALSLYNYRQTRWKYFPPLSESYNIPQQNKFLLRFDAQINFFFYTSNNVPLSLDTNNSKLDTWKITIHDKRCAIILYAQSKKIKFKKITFFVKQSKYHL